MIQINHLRKQFGNLIAVDDLSLEIRDGEILGFLGPNGAGKTTTIRMLCGLLEHDSGQIIWNNNQGRLADVIGFCPQENIFWPRLTCLEQLVFMGIMYGMDNEQATNRADELLNILGLDPKKQILAEKLSGGMKRRLNIALALIHDPPVLVLDEPEAGLDPQSRILVRDLIKSLANKKTVIITTHNMDEAERLTDRVAIVDQGKLLKLDTVENLKRSIGEGDMLEISLVAPIKESTKIQQLKGELDLISKQVTFLNGKLQIRSKGILEKLSEITTILKQNHLAIDEIQHRKNTLEDVFIHLTGRGLRE
ncbi:MAG: ABC transporter ATP-binding protein [Candidatus Marinimicrobia bacterium]|nr:ABC transporter ATP-binding protein [Candidatus Neomarinimicrobiota bacterium]